MVRNEADWHNHDILDSRARSVHVANKVADIRLEPRLLRRPAPALVDQVPRFSADAFGNKSRRLAKLLLITTTRRHRLRNAMSRKDKLCVAAALCRNLF